MKPKDLKRKIKKLGPWRHDIDLGSFSTFDVAESVGPHSNIGHPEPRWEYIKQFLPEEKGKALDVGCNAGGVSFRLEKEGWDVTGIDCFQDFELKTHPLRQAKLCKQVLDSEVKFIDANVLEYLPKKKFDLMVALGVLYHMADSNEGDKRELEEKFVDVMVDSEPTRIIIETKPRKWLGEYIENKGWELLVNKMPWETPKGSRQVVVANGYNS